MLSGIKVVNRQDVADRKDKKKKKKHRRHKDKKGEKKSSKIEHHSSTDNASDDNNNNDNHHDTQPAPPPPQPPPLQRENWMSAAMARPIDAPVYQMKDDTDTDNYQQQEGKGTTEPTSKVVDLAKVLNKNDNSKSTASTVGVGVGVGDGGASWRLKALQRAKQGTQEEGAEGGDGSGGGGGRGVGQAIQERWGSLSNLLGQQQQQPAHNLAHLHAAKNRRRVEGNNGDGEDDKNNNKNRSMYLRDVKSTRGQMRRPREDFGNRDAHNSPRGEGGGGNHNNKLQVLSWRRKNEDLIKEAAAEMNTFQNDGSFMQQFKSEVKEKEKDKDKDKGRNEAKYDSSKVEVETLAAAAAAALKPKQPLQQKQGGGGGGGDPNKSAAAILRARLMGKVPYPPAASSLLPIPPPFSNSPPSFNTTTHHPLPTPSSRNPPKHNAYEGGERKRYFADDDTTDLQTLMKRTKYETSAAARGQAVGDMDVAIARGIMKNQRYTEAEFDADAEYDHDAGIAHLGNDGRGSVGNGARRQMNKETVDSMAKRQERQQWQQHKRMASALDRCQLCFASASRPKHLTLAIGQHTYLALPSRGRLVAGHVVIVPIEHVASIRQADEAVLTEIRNFKKCLIQMHAAAGGKECVFYETATRVEDGKSHTVIECVPLPPAAAARAPLVFRKTVDDASDEWSDHHSKRIIDIGRSKTGLQGSIPPNFPYMCVEFGLSEGFVHVIDNERGFKRNLARSVLVGLLGLSEEKGGQQRVRGESETAQTQWAVEFRKQFDPYDWTNILS